jgi:hypothetical protein
MISISVFTSFLAGFIADRRRKLNSRSNLAASFSRDAAWICDAS